jgi:hypothetical protein
VFLRGTLLESASREVATTVGVEVIAWGFKDVELDCTVADVCEGCFKFDTEFADCDES